MTDTTKIVYLVRHGVTTGNEANIHQSASTPLSDHGMKQASLLAKRCKSLDFDLLMSSDMTRASQTAEHIATATNKAISYNPLFREMKRPSSIIGHKSDDPKVHKVKREMLKHLDNPFWHYQDEENTYEVIERCRQALEYLSERSEKRILVVAHSNVIRVLLAHVMFNYSILPSQLAGLKETLWLNNTGISTLLYVKQKWRIGTVNDHEHLGESIA